MVTTATAAIEFQKDISGVPVAGTAINGKSFIFINTSAAQASVAAVINNTNIKLSLSQPLQENTKITTVAKLLVCWIVEEYVYELQRISITINFVAKMSHSSSHQLR
jgi:hypothetical protein